MITSAEYARGLRLLADWIEANPNMTLPPEQLNIYSLNSKEDATKCILAMKPCKEDYDGSLFRICRDFGPISLRYIFARSAVCTRKVIGTKVVPEKIKAAMEEEIIPEHEEDIYEWVCDEPLLKSEEI